MAFFVPRFERYTSQFLDFNHTTHVPNPVKIIMGKRVKRPNKVPEQTNKHVRVQKKSQPSPQRNLRKNEEDKSGRPGPSSYQAPQGGLHLHHHPDQLPSQQPGQGGRRRFRLRLNPPKPQKLPSSSQTEPTDPRWSYSQTSTCYSQDVATYDVGRGVKSVGTPQAEDIEYWGSTKGAAHFIRSHSGLGEDWIGVRPLGKGGYGLAGLWELRGDDGQIIKVRIHTRQPDTSILIIAEANGRQRGSIYEK